MTGISLLVAAMLVMMFSFNSVSRARQRAVTSRRGSSGFRPSPGRVPGLVLLLRILLAAGRDLCGGQFAVLSGTHGIEPSQAQDA